MDSERNCYETNIFRGPAKQWYSHLPQKTKKNRQAFCREFQKTFDNQQRKTEAKLLLVSTTGALGEHNEH